MADLVSYFRLDLAVLKYLGAFSSVAMDICGHHN